MIITSSDGVVVRATAIGVKGPRIETWSLNKSFSNIINVYNWQDYTFIHRVK